MSRPLLRRVCAVSITTAAMTAVVAAPSPAMAADMSFSRSSGTVASTTWLEMGELPAATGAPGNAHFGELQVEDLGRGRARAFGIVYDVQCAEGAKPYLPGGGHGAPVPPSEEAPAEACTLELVRFIEGGRDLTFSIDRKLTKATLTGSLAVNSGHGEGPTGTPAVSITWNGVGAGYSSTESGSFTDEYYGTYSYRYSFRGRDAAVAAGSRIGPMVFDDETGESSTGQLGMYKQSSRSRG